ncbi:TetR/AcrR family transcriptional regulator [Cytobacillus gottheilii]|uniref:TetR/AcrR family transcriptional regulator n=1 Tax=Cytobacillus gottheilii TaxID=859144 RepID=A0ABX8F814_9BACI|nr:TetR/AcrR family transcriptional regulator [Cytobacillus gottheilii]QVY59687.1 TetR/AcrR family transcriptional regulator [Cytobacillus gottheilii]
MHQIDKRSRLIKAAYKIFSQKGFYNSSIKDIAAEAEITPGLVHYYFKNKEELLFSVQESIQTEYQKQYEGKQMNVDMVLQEIQSRVEEDPDWYRFRYELYSLGLKKEEYKDEVKAILQSGKRSLAQPLEDHFIMNKKKSEGLSSILLACFDGLAYQKLIDENFDLDESYRTLKKMVEIYICVGGEKE